MKSFGMWRLPVLLVGLGGAALFLSPACKAQEVSSDHFTDTGVQNVYENAPVKAATPELKQKPLRTQAHQHAKPSATLQAAVERTPSMTAKPSAQPVAEKRKGGQNAPKKP
ncbi:MAG TPA: hypothetical protein VN025_13465 [Candidatus Dormibacteraeota bacterium]|jgi:hypothetical protein|nr:hypothetical protein [Candidatus Dormibacteraeota bacterium]